MAVTWERAGSDFALWTADVVAAVVTGWLDGDRQWVHSLGAGPLDELLRHHGGAVQQRPARRADGGRR
ncbi:hypothetical protein ACFQ08_00355 [Streptosporangium algeriense]|uniref:Uncharacterized protein n=1 Tax=Streptosporangium algeriense TaxID=1682748 RepID=A0ABW3DI23_9ACTN